MQSNKQAERASVIVSWSRDGLVPAESKNESALERVLRIEGEKRLLK